MSGGEPEDIANTIKEMESPSNHNESDKNWLRHKHSSQGAHIDYMLLEGQYSIEEMADELNTTINRIQSHFNHLTKYYNQKMAPHNLVLTKVNNKWMFDKEKMKDK